MKKHERLILEGLLACSSIPGFAVRDGWAKDVIELLTEKPMWEDENPATRGRRLTP